MRRVGPVVGVPRQNHRSQRRYCDISYDDGDREMTSLMPQSGRHRRGSRRRRRRRRSPGPAAADTSCHQHSSGQPGRGADSECRICRNCIPRLTVYIPNAVTGRIAPHATKTEQEKDALYLSFLCHPRAPPCRSRGGADPGPPEGTRDPPSPFGALIATTGVPLLGIHKDDQSSTIPTLRCYDCHERWASPPRRARRRPRAAQCWRRLGMACRSTP